MLIIVAIPMSGSPAFTKSRKWKPPIPTTIVFSWHPNRGGVGAGTADDARHQDSRGSAPIPCAIERQIGTISARGWLCWT